MRGGCEALIHTVRALLEQNEEAEILQVNFRNAFNEADSAIAFNELKKHFPELTHLVASCYGVAAHLVYGDTNIPSTTSFHQGDALAVLLFALTLQPIILKILDEVPSLKTNSWFLDDGILAGTREELVKAVRILLEEGPAHGLQLSTEHVVPYPGTSKCALWCGREGPKETDPLGVGILPIEGPGFVHLGAPVGRWQHSLCTGEGKRASAESPGSPPCSPNLGECPWRVCTSEVMLLPAQGVLSIEDLPPNTLMPHALVQI